ncbi:excalibur calcium-binding domain-containing protein [bacterium]|nr:excalibur calcium-binding domain-containing protein [bacterium]MBU1433365.1 excalibur calcium-binding domain-containing protein [bacterium]MBU1503439.1 excalibur calcium-binding domain-containing protein [bacterium]
MKTITLIFILLTSVCYGSQEDRTKQKSRTTNSNESNRAFKCDGRQHCSQMNSCEEALFFIKNCPNTKMDGDHDGKPCEEQLCGH